ncbi:tetratricopeptide repeat protein [Nonomuraea phyllanthi]|uniref:BTAD domain-containing putative transcriptional regulator n=1 Tax=Nonomuraea phyllanthi TaxID=2219224 RepID=UPI001293C147|nr:BTAD domain-containing putative transcriptional regulator [Nonomuraea phyllanthi]QFY07746.1 tetratricopeptide repeat protein [Nonomuraea phyllanthi]
MENLSDVLRLRREQAGLTQQELAARAGVSVAVIRDVEQGRTRRPRTETIRRLSDVLQLSAPSPDGSRGGQGPSTVWLRILGPLEVRASGSVVPLSSERQRGILGLLALSANHVVLMESIAEALWGEAAGDGHIRAVHGHVSRLRRALRHGRREELISCRQHGYQLSVADGEVDTLAFRSLLRQARDHRDRAEPDAAAESYGRAIDLWRDSPLLDVPALRDHPKVCALSAERVTAAIELAEVAESLGRHDLVLSRLRAITQVERLHEQAHARLMIALAGCGQQAAALEVFGDISRRLADDLGISPGPELVSAQLQVLRQGTGGHGPLEIRAPGIGGRPGSEQGPGAPPPGTGAPSAPRELPPMVPGFVGRTELIDALVRDVVDRSPRPVLISGCGGIGKSALAVQVAWKAADRFPDGQFYLNLHGSTPDLEPLEPLHSLGRLLRSLGVDRAAIPQDVDEAAAQFRSRTAGRRMLFVFDNVLDVKQVRALLPASPACGVIVTSRRTLASLEGRIPYELEVLSEEDARTLLTSHAAGHARSPGGAAAPRPDAEAQSAVARQCAYLPLALSIAAARLSVRPAWTWRTLADRLAEEGRRLTELEVEDRAVRAGFMVGYRDLDRAQARMFRSMSLLDVTEFGVDTAAALAGVSPSIAEDLLDQLTEAHLVQTVAPGRYSVHDLTRLFARELSAAHDPPEERRRAVGRALHTYLAAARDASSQVIPVAVWRTTLGPATTGARPGFRDRHEVYAWVDAEAAQLPAAMGSAAALGADDLVTALSAALFFPLYERGRWRELCEISEVGATAADRLGDPRHRAVTHGDLGYVLADLGRLDEALVHLKVSLEQHRLTGNRRGEAAQLDRLGVVYSRLGRFAEAIGNFRLSVDLENGQGNRYGEAITLTNLGLTYLRSGNLEAAVTAFGDALSITREIEDLVGSAVALGYIAETHRRMGHFEESERYFLMALDADRAADDLGSCTEAGHWWGLGLSRHALGAESRARECRRNAATILHGLRLIGPDERTRIESSPDPGTPEVILRNL